MEIRTGTLLHWVPLLGRCAHVDLQSIIYEHTFLSARKWKQMKPFITMCVCVCLVISALNDCQTMCSPLWYIVLYCIAFLLLAVSRNTVAAHIAIHCPMQTVEYHTFSFIEKCICCGLHHSAPHRYILLFLLFADLSQHLTSTGNGGGARSFSQPGAKKI